MPKAKPGREGGGASRSPTQLDVRLGRLIRDRRQELGLNQTDLARGLDLAQAQLQKYETGENRISASRLVDIARILKVPVAWFYRALGVEREANGPPLLAVNDQEMLLLRSFRQLSPSARRQLQQIAQVLIGDRTIDVSES